MASLVVLHGVTAEFASYDVCLGGTALCTADFSSYDIGLSGPLWCNCYVLILALVVLRREPLTLLVIFASVVMHGVTADFASHDYWPQ